MSGYRRGYRRTYAPTAGRIDKPNRRPGDCRTCGEEVPAFGGLLYREESGAWSVVHRPMEWSGSPVSGHYAGGCPASTDAKNADAPWNRDGHVRPESERIAAVASLAAASASDAAERYPRRPGGYAVLNSGAVVRASSYRCEDAPCCGCCP